MTTESEQPKYDPELDPQLTLRADLWPVMNISELSRQQEIIVDRLNMLNTMVYSIGSPSVHTMYKHMQGAMEHVSNLITHRSQQK